MTVSEYTTKKLILTSWVGLSQGKLSSNPATPITPKKSFQPLKPVRQWLDRLEIHNSKLAHRICQLIPAQCPFEREIKLFGRTLLYIPPMCKLNPLYDEVVALRFRALCYLADECGEDISAYC
ncbi:MULTISPECIES: Mo-dependent nitrogenase C-terminal domain-containing protein [unclassified Coleofasciculus]|uniref:Mo-dependent nitrogenase C-terminal domain-containing protein n=1 Tax=unclassified Coleofasciculus TaxID=2692782 RepID=UPI00188121AE|nr:MULTISPECIES: Mo-dependent nitrogenase C-terminal domain-containing protein [unclassified Coleofasciculus]MBE9125123.1 Mo-dependent nitrogenase C-terminal domain-containing protein [Coleofasciculus sp. LEGE 07081]MBE9148340.1 Mo-dependent nitrogenase C-terminal domain-containing protein [Coleofasciculus sp. LEGE 07092]